MLNLKHPGVYTQELSSGVRPIAGASTSVALFVGPTATGIDGRPTRLFNFGDFERAFGAPQPSSNLGTSVMHFFANGGAEAWVVRTPPEGAVAAAATLQQDEAPVADSFTATALSAGAPSGEIFVEIDPFGLSADPFGAAPDKTLFNLVVTDRASGASERFGALSTSAASPRFAPAIVNDAGRGSALVGIDLPADAVGDPAPPVSGSVYAVGTPPAAGAAFAADVKVTLEVDFLAADGSVDAPASVSLEVTAFAMDEARPASAQELALRLGKALNKALAADETVKDRMGGRGVAVAQVEGGAFLHLKLSGPSGARGGPRRDDGILRLAAPAAGTSLLDTYALTAEAENPARIQLGQTYDAALVAAPVAAAAGQAHGQPAPGAIKDAVLALEGRDPFFNILCIPDLVRPAATDPKAEHHSDAMPTWGEAARVCGLKHAMLLVDPPPDVTDAEGAELWKSGRFTFQSDHAAAYFPNIRVDDPAAPGTLRSHPPSGAIAGLMARTDAAAGVWQAPAGTSAVLAGAYAPAVVLSDSEAGLLNPIGLNAIRQFPVFGTVAFGSRTVDGADALASDYKYIPVRRTADYILRSLSEGLRWAVHRPNGEQLWAELRLAGTSFMQQLFRAGAFKGTTPSEAFFVRCDASTTTQADIDLGRVNIDVGFAPLKPAEFVVISLHQVVQAAE
ncbi:phage tail sheath family protein [Rhodovulum sp. DZ06]|uniref:phage tail sheath family protein n=1 Tax=Rhodovulum sp. DZ06 TaxID=3425126 RepID=UPI003D359AA3